MAKVAGAALSLALQARRRPDTGVATLVRLLPRLWPAGTAALAAAIVCRALLAVAYLPVLGKLVADASALTVHHAGAWHRVALDFAALAGVRVLERIATPAVQLLATALGRRLTAFSTASVLAGTLTPTGIAHLEDPSLADGISLAQGAGSGSFPPDLAVTALAQKVGTRLAGLGAAVLLARILWWAPVPLVLSWRLAAGWIAGQLRARVRSLQHDTPALRRASYLSDLGLDGAAAKEIRLFGIAPWLVGRFTSLWTEGMREVLGNRTSSRAGAGWAVLLTAVHAAVLGSLSLAAARGSLGIAGLAVGVQAVFAMISLGWAGDVEWALTAGSAALPHVLTIAERASRPVTSAAAGESAEHLPAKEIRFESVSFAHPGARTPVLAGLDLTIPAGGSVALVGENGAGKTTLIKLLARCYEPDEGRISVDGIDLAAFDPYSWRRQLAIVFQDFLRFELPARDNVAFGRIDETIGAAALHSAVLRSGADGIIAGLPGGWDTPLSRAHPGGVDLSGGQWQRLALARALLAVDRGAGVLVLDEPTAHLDLRAEIALHERLIELTREITTIVVSHRFSTVRMAERICVLHQGKIIEQGSHGQLMAAGGRYARLFRLQAREHAGDLDA